MLWKADIRVMWHVLEAVTEDYSKFEKELLLYDPRGDWGSHKAIVDLLDYMDNAIHDVYPFTFEDYLDTTKHDVWGDVRWAIVTTLTADYLEERIFGLTLDRMKLSIDVTNVCPTPRSDEHDQGCDHIRSYYHEYLNKVHGSTEDGFQFYERSD